jgi:nucleoid-associated protein YgaU
MALVKAVLEILDAAAGLPGQVEVQFNPTEYTRSKAVQLAEIGIPGLDSPVLQFIRGQNERLTVDLLFDTTDESTPAAPVDVRNRTDPLYQLVKVQSQTHAPPRFRLTWGKGLSFTAVAESVQQHLTLFAPTGIPLRSTVSLALREYVTVQQQLNELNLQSPDHTRQRVVRRGETLAAIAAAEYGDSAAWRVLAAANPGVDPVRPAPGSALELPPLDPVVPLR